MMTKILKPKLGCPFHKETKLLIFDSIKTADFDVAKETAKLPTNTREKYFSSRFFHIK